MKQKSLQKTSWWWISRFNSQLCKKISLAQCSEITKMVSYGQNYMKIQATSFWLNWNIFLIMLISERKWYFFESFSNTVLVSFEAKRVSFAKLFLLREFLVPFWKGSWGDHNIISVGMTIIHHWELLFSDLYLMEPKKRNHYLITDHKRKIRL